MPSRARLRPFVAFAAGLVFAAGLGISGMTRPEKVRAFLDLGGDWDPSLLLVMGAAVPVHAVAWWILRRRGGSLLGGAAPGMPAPVFDLRLFGGAALFGVGWGLAGACPGPAVVSIAAGGGAFIFVPAMLAGVALSRFVAKRPVMDVLPQESEDDEGVGATR